MPNYEPPICFSLAISIISKRLPETFWACQDLYLIIPPPSFFTVTLIPTSSYWRWPQASTLCLCTIALWFSPASPLPPSSFQRSFWCWPETWQAYLDWQILSKETQSESRKPEMAVKMVGMTPAQQVPWSLQASDCLAWTPADSRGPFLHSRPPVKVVWWASCPDAMTVFSSCYDAFIPFKYSYEINLRINYNNYNYEAIENFSNYNNRAIGEVLRPCYTLGIKLPADLK